MYDGFDDIQFHLTLLDVVGVESAMFRIASF